MMANEKQLAILKQGPKIWNKWRGENEDIPIDLSGADLKNTVLLGINFSKANLTDCNLTRAYLDEADLSEANLSGAFFCEAIMPDTNLDLAYTLLKEVNFSKAALHNSKLGQSKLNGAIFTGALMDHIDSRGGTFTRANFSDASLRNAVFVFSGLEDANFSGATLYDAMLTGTFHRAKFIGANLTSANLQWADLTEADLTDADLTQSNLHQTNLHKAKLSNTILTNASLVDTNLSEANLTKCKIYGISAWNLNLLNATQNSLIVTPDEESTITVDDLEVAQFIYLMINNQKIKNVIDSITSKSVLILGRFTRERKKVLDAVGEELRKRNYLPIIFDFDKPVNRDLTETISLLARMAHFIIADLSDPKSLPQELTSIIPDLPSIPIQPIIASDQMEYAMYEHWKRYPWVLDIQRYETLGTLLNNLVEKIVVPPEKWIDEQKNK